MPKKIETIKHKDKRTNIPTEELRDFVKDEERTPKAVQHPGLRYARDPSLDPQLVWKGKDEQDQKPLEVPAVPIYIQEKIQPLAIIEQVKAEARREAPSQASLFGDFNGIPFEKQIEFYQHKDGVNWANRMILGDSLLVMTSLAEKEGLKGQVQMIYIDPPYGIKFGSNWQVSTRKRDVKDGKVEDATRQPEQIRAFRDTWQLGVHSYLSYLRDRLVVARELVSETGSVFVQMGDENVHLVRSLLDEVLGAENFIALITVTKTSSATTEMLAGVADYLLWYGKAKEQTKYRELYEVKQFSEASSYTRLQLPDGTRRSLSSEESQALKALPTGARPYTLGDLTSQRPPGSFPVQFNGVTYVPRTNFWKTGEIGFHKLIKASRVEGVGNVIRYVRYFGDFPAMSRNNVWTDFGGAPDKIYVVQTNTRIAERCLLMTTDPGDLVLDPTCGSGTTAYVAEQWGRRWITCDTSRVALALARTRLMAAKFPYYYLADSPEGIQKEAEASGKLPPNPLPKTENDIKKAFVFKRVPHITLKSIANNDEIDTIHGKWQPQLDKVRSELNKLLKQKWEEWEIPHELPGSPQSEMRNLHSEWWRLLSERQKEIDDSIARHADTELLYDQPYEDNKRIRVTGPFTVESLSPHRILTPSEERPSSETEAQKEMGAGKFEMMILENLRKAGVQNTVRDERLKFDRLEPFAGTWLQAAGEYSDREGKSRRVTVSLGPEHGTVGPDQVKEAAKEALRGMGFDLLLVCGFAFDAHASETAREFNPTPKSPRDFAIAEDPKAYGKLQVQLVRMNPDLAMGDELLKKTGAGNLFMIFGEPDLDIVKTPDGKVALQLKGVDVYDPTTGEIRNHSTDDIACWFIDTDYNGESFFVRHAYFTGADEPYDKLKRALRSDIDEAAWASLYSTTSRPFDLPKTGKIAVKVINHYGDEVLKAYEVKPQS